VKPNLIICGVRKAATTSLFYYLSQHPDVGACRIKEPSYFTPLKYGRQPRPWGEYLKLFSHCRDKKYRMEATPGYFSGGADLAYPIARMLDRPRVVVILRNPVETFASNFNFLRSRTRIDLHMSMEEYLEACEDMHARGADRLWENRDYNSLLAGTYCQFLPAWQDALGERFKVLFFEDLMNDPKGVVRSLFAWLELPTAPAETLNYSIENKTEQYKTRWLQRLALACNRRWGFFFQRFHGVKQCLRNAYYLINRDPGGNRPLPAACRARLESIFAEPNRRLVEQLLRSGHQRLPSWLAQYVDSCEASAHATC
jgi:hypothetical protein